jgi:hypothetical protein
MSIVPGECVVTFIFSPHNLLDYGLPYSLGRRSLGYVPLRSLSSRHMFFPM